MASIKILFTKPKKFNLIAEGIKLFTWAPYCHVALSLENRVFQATADGAQWDNLERFNQTHESVAIFEIPLSPTDQSKVLEVCDRFRGRPYDYKAVGGLALYRLAYVFGWTMKSNPLANHTQFLFCSELAYEVLHRLHIIPAARVPEVLDPKRFLRYLENAKVHRVQ